MALIEKTVEYEHLGETLEAYMAYDDAGSTDLPGVLVAHTWRGRSEFECDKARNLAALGYVGFAIDMYGNGKLGNNPDESAAMMQPFMDDRARLATRVKAGLDALLAQAEVDNRKVAAMGYCFGGLCVLDLARTGVDIGGVISFHGLLGQPDNVTADKINCKVLVLHGHDDPMAPVEHVVALQEELTAKCDDWQIHVYGQTMHAFTNPQANDPGFGTVYNSAADRRSWWTLVQFLSETFD